MQSNFSRTFSIMDRSNRKVHLPNSNTRHNITSSCGPKKEKNTQSTKVITEIDEWTENLKSLTPNKTQDFFHAVLKLNNGMRTYQTEKFKVRSI